ncbi:hypothetical protein JAAARDRAFT_33120 [Jaapia argillacea MUCL 33604]|uniref:Aminopeptidase n=1 Tax=Jaapia argillacea MUCL 33604 TaxID=933084 RepID=A0A067PXJ4_9AGAM|nr:hypothetical protein JAAARDRAFT_33120 [Jaapia argillacea MUCL 33604]
MSSGAVSKASSDGFRLPEDIVPTHYDVTVKTDLEKLAFDGFVKIDLDVKKETSTIVFNSSELTLGHASLISDAFKVEQSGLSVLVDKDTERATVQSPTPLPAGSKVQLRVGFEGKLTGSMMGYYKSTWEDQGRKKNYALTQFEPTAARRAFPCWDEPLLKATFGITLISRADTVNLSNMPVISEEVYNPSSKPASDIPELSKLFESLSTADQATEKWKITRFEPTPRMSTYIVAYANGHFDYLESSYKSPLSGKTRPLRIYATSDNIHMAQFALDVKAKVLPIYEQVFDVEYPLPKLDTLVASDFDAGAMENWGLITGRTSVFLLDPKRADLVGKKRVATVQSHEVAHMWFGNITTMSWWDNLYLNEGFATLMGEVIITGKVFPEWKVESEFITQHLGNALDLDAKLSSHPIEVECPDANQINQIFDALSYAKAGSVLRMLSNYVGEDRFLKGVSLYLKNRLYGSSVTKDLWDGISEATGIDVAKMMDNWITKMGFPVLTVTETKHGIKVRQDRFLETGPAEPKDNETIWTIPLNILTVDKDGRPSVDKTAVLDEREKFIPLDTSLPFKLNAGTTGVYRVLYTPDRLAKIAAEAAKKDSIFPLNDRIGLVHDALVLSRAGFAKLSSALTVMSLLKNEEEFLVWDSIANNLQVLKSTWFEHQETVDLLDDFTRALFAPLVKRLGYVYSETDSADISQLRTKAISMAASANDEAVVNELKSRFADFRKSGDESKIPADLQRVIYSTAVKHGGKEEYDVMKAIHEKPTTPQVGIAAMLAMGSSRDLALAKETLDYTLTNARDQDVMYFFSGLQSNPLARRILAQFFKDNYDALYKRFEGNFSLSYLVKMSFSGLATVKDKEETELFFKDKDVSKYRLALSQMLDTINAKAAFIDRSSTDLSEWLKKWKQGVKL